MRTALRGARAAFVFMTRVPVGGFPYAASEWRWASGWLPLVGLAVGSVCAVVWWLVAPLGAWVAGASALVASVLLTGAFHEDGLADTADALGGAYDRKTVLAILKDSRVGAFGALALVTAFAFRLVLLAELGSAAIAALPMVHCLARVGPVWLMVAMPYVSDAEAKGRQVARAGVAQGVLAAVVGLVVVAGVVTVDGLAGVGEAVAAGAAGTGDAEAGGMVGDAGAGSVVGVPAGIAAVAAMALSTVACGWRFHARAGGVTGDFLGATEQVNEIAILFAVLALQVQGMAA